MGCVVVGLMIEGWIPIPTQLRLVPGLGSPTPIQTVVVVSAEAHRKPLTELVPMTKAGLQVRGIQERSGFGIKGKWNIQKGDFLVYP